MIDPLSSTKAFSKTDFDKYEKSYDENTVEKKNIIARIVKITHVKK